MIKFSYTIFYVKDVARTITFYENAFGFERKFITEENDYAELITGDTTLSFASIELAKTNLSKGFLESNVNNKPFGMEIGITTDNVSEIVTMAIKAGAILVEEAKTKPWGQIVAYVKDPNGYLIEICTPIS
ncbi:MAG: VOC family protein [Bacteroidota bacterium]|nr:VOC family protein [Bacteroidota bacterium]